LGAEVKEARRKNEEIEALKGKWRRKRKDSGHG
jgi:hypothetical protein